MVNEEEVKTFVGIDAHSRNCTVLGLSRKGRTVYEGEMVTEAACLVDAVRSLRAPVWVMLESGSMAAYVKRSIEGAVDRVVVCETRQNRWISHGEDKCDRRDAEKLARLLRMGEYKEVWLSGRDGYELREVVRLASKTLGDVVRAKNRLKAKLREHGLLGEKRDVYSEDARPGVLASLDRPALREMVKVLYAQLDAAQSAHECMADRLSRTVSGGKAYRKMVEVPGVGGRLAPIFIGVIDDPGRFANKRKLWKYAGLGVRSQASGKGGNAREGGSTEGNRLLKHASMVAARCAINGENRYSRHYAQMVERGMDSRVAAKAVARSILATVWSVWKDDTRYRPQ